MWSYCRHIHLLKSLNIYKNVFKSELKIKIKQTSYKTVYY